MKILRLLKEIKLRSILFLSGIVADGSLNDVCSGQSPFEHHLGRLVAVTFGLRAGIRISNISRYWLYSSNDTGRT